jgi:hypothetical protein
MLSVLTMASSLIKLAMQPAKCQVTTEAPDLKTKNGIMYCLIRAIADLGEQ